MSAPETDESQALEAIEKVSVRSWLAVIGAALGAFMAVLDIQITNSSLPDIQGALGATLDEGTWISTSYLVAEIVVIPLTVWLSRVFTTRAYVIANAVLFIAFSICCAWAWDLQSMIVFRALQGLTGGTLIPMAFSIVLTTLPPSKRAIGMAIYGTTATFAPSIGPALGGWLTYNFNWKYIFYLNIFPGVIFITLLWLTLPREKLRLDLLKQGDWLGIFTMAGGLGCLEIVLEEGNRKDWFGSPFIATLAVISAVSLALFLWIELRQKNPLVNLRLLSRRNFGLGSIANITLGLGLYGSIYLLPVYLAQLQDYSSLQVGQVLMWMGLPQLLIIPLVPRIMQLVDTRYMLAWGLCLFGSSCFMNAFMTHDSSGPEMIVSLLVRALGQPFIFIPLSALATSEIEKEQSGSASALFNMMRNLGGSFGIAIISTFLTHREQLHSSRLTESISATSTVVQNRISELTQTMITSGSDPYTAHQQALQLIAATVRREALVMAYNDSFFILGCALFACVVTAFLLRKAKTGATAPAH
jgi:DHA2 family multidrug resistance protein